MRKMKLSFVGAALLISVLSTDAQNYIQNPPPPPPPPPPAQEYSGSQVYSAPPNFNSRPPEPANRGYRDNVYFGNSNPQYPPPPSWFPRDFGPPNHDRIEKLLESFLDTPLFEMFEQVMNMFKKNGAWRKQRRHQQRGHFRYYTGPPQGYDGPPQGNFGPPQVYFGPPQGYPGTPQGYSVPGTQPSGSAVPPPSGTQQSNYGSPPNPGMYNYPGSVPQQQPFPGQPLPIAPAPAPAASGVQVSVNSTLPVSGIPGNSTAANGQTI